MARLAATAVLLLCLLAVASYRVLEVEPDTVVAISEEQSQDDHDVPRDVAAKMITSLPTVAVDPEAIPRLPSHRRPCRHEFLHRHLRWARNHGRGAFAGPGESRVLPAVLPEEPREAVVEVEAVAEPDPDSRPDTDAERKPFLGDEEEGEENELAKAWKGEMLRRFRRHGLRFHHHHHHEHAVEKDGSAHQEQQDKEEGAGDVQLQHVKLFGGHFRHHNHGDEETVRKHHFHHQHHHDGDSEVDDVEELARRLSKAIMRRSFGRGSIRHHHHAEEGV